jgi:hypothetical protein
MYELFQATETDDDGDPTNWELFSSRDTSEELLKRIVELMNDGFVDTDMTYWKLEER